jgi:DNA (cytosine-5)-methyltransferase 1
MLPINVVDLFCGAGGLSYGLKSAGLNVVAGIDNNPDCVYPFETNVCARCLVKDVRQVSGEEILALFPKRGIKVLAGCAPCQPFSSLSNKNKERSKDEKWSLLAEFSRIIKEVSPDIVTMENVPQLRKERPLGDFCSALDSMGYDISNVDGVVNCEGYGVPQKRRRLVLMASKNGGLRLIPETHAESSFLTVKDAIWALEPLEAGKASFSDPLHRCQGMSTMNMKRIQASQPGGSWMDWPMKLRVRCHKESKGESYTPVYGRMAWDEPSPTITTQFYNYGSGRFGHPEQDRPISFREGAMLQSFPHTYKFINPENRLSWDRLATLIGNAVPVKLGDAIGNSILIHTSQYEGGSSLPAGMS